MENIEAVLLPSISTSSSSWFMSKAPKLKTEELDICSNLRMKCTTPAEIADVLREKLDSIDASSRPKQNFSPLEMKLMYCLDKVVKDIQRINSTPVLNHHLRVS
jgi:hypothetical protein